MRKAIFAVLIVALAMLATTCDSAVLPANLSSEQGPGAGIEPEWTTVTIVTPESRARLVNATIASSNADLYEAVFVYDKDGGANKKTIRSIKPSGGDWTVNVPKVNYSIADSSNYAVVFAGIAAVTTPTPPDPAHPNILLGIGTISNGGNLLATGATNTITFAMESVKSGVSKTLSSSAFQILGPTGFVSPNTIPNGLDDDLSADGNDYKAYPMFVIPEDTAYTAPVGTTSNIRASYKFSNAKLSYAIANGSPSVSATAIDTGVTATINGTTATTDGTGLTVTFAIATGATEGLTKLSISVPVYAVSATQDNSTTATAWTLQAGKDNALLDDHTTFAGGAVLVHVGVPPQPPEPPVTVAVTSTGYGWVSNDNTWEYTINGDAVAITLTASASNIGSLVTYGWFVAGTVSPSPEVTDPGDSPATSLGAPTSNTATLTIPATSGSLATIATYYVYCKATDGTKFGYSDFIVIDVAPAGDDTVTITITTPWT